MNTAVIADDSDTLRVLLPSGATIFAARAQRFRELASKESGLAPFLTLMGRIAEAQQAACAAIPNDPPRARSEGPEPPLATDGPLPAIWRLALTHVLDGLQITEGPVGQCIAALREMSPETLDAQAAALLSGNPAFRDRGTAALIAAALQTVWTVQAGRLDSALLQQSDREPGHCPVCGSLPVASLLLAGGSTQGSRYLCCPLCSTQWHLPRIRCVHCGAIGRIAYYAVEGSDGAVRAEACDDCQTYTKILNREKQPGLDPVADDLATLALDIMMAEAGYARFGLNPLLIPGD